MRHCRSLLSVFLLFLLSASAAQAQTGGPATLAPVTWALEGSPTPALKAWWSSVARRIVEADPSAWTSSGGDPVTVTLTGKPSAWAAVIQRPSTGGIKYLPFAEADETSALELSRLTAALVRPSAPLRAAPVLVDRFDVSSLQGVDLPGGAGLLYPSSLALGAGGTLLVATGSAVLEFDRRWMPVGQPAKTLSDRGLLNFAWTAALTPAGTLFVRSADGSSLWSLAPGGGARKWPTDAPAAGMPFGVLSDGRPFAVTSAPPGVRIGSGTDARFQALPAGTFVLAAAPGPGGSLWLADNLRGLIRVLDAEGGLADIVAPELPAGTAMMKLRVGADGGFWLLTNRDLRRFAPGGGLLWVRDNEGLAPGTADFQPGADGLLYLSDFSSRTISRLCEDAGALPPDLQAVRRASEAARQPGARPEAWKALAEVYLSQGAAEAALAALDRYLADRPADGAALDRRRRAQRDLGKARAGAAAADALAQLASFGPETGGDAYRRAMKSYEALRAAFPGDPDITGPLEALRDAFASAQTAPALPVPRLGATVLGPLFPSLLQGYRLRPAGTLAVTNTTGEPMRGLRAEVRLARFVDLPASGPALASLAPGAETNLDLFVPLNDQALALEEDLPVQAAVTLRWTDRRGDRSLETVVPVTLFRRTALSWDDTGKLAAFVTPNEETVGRAAFDLLPEAQPAPVGGAVLNRAAALADGLGSLPLRYVPDPASPFSSVQGAVGAVDTVRFPRNTLAYRGGDCDDSTALLASVLEAAGIPTALLTTPGHVFLAFDTGEPAASAWLYTGAGRRSLVREGRLWVPVETTVLAEGFDAAWKAASVLVDRYEGGPDFEFLPVAGLRDRYPPLPLPPALGPGPRWDPAALAARRASTAQALTSALLPALSAALEPRDRPAAQRAAASNRLARAQAVWGRPDLAEATLRAVVADNPRWAPAYLNLAALRLGQGDPAGARGWLTAARKASADAALVAAWAAKAGLEAGPAAGPAVADQGPAAGGRASASAVPGWAGE